MSAVLVVLLTVAAVLAGNLRGGGKTVHATSSTSSTAAGDSVPAAEAGAAAPSPTIMGPGQVQKGATTSFVTTTLLVTTTSSTTTTLVEGGALTVRGGPLSLDPGESGSLLIANTGAGPLRWGVASSSSTVTARPTGGTLEPAETVSVRVSAAGGASAGTTTLTFVSGGGVRTVRVTVGSVGPLEPELAASLSFDPAAPNCSTTVTATLTVSGSASSVQGRYTVGNAGSSTPLSFNGKSPRWTASIPAQPAATRVRVSATVSGASGTSVSTAASYLVAAGSC